MYGTELARTGELQDIACANWLWWDFLEEDSRVPLGDWTKYLEKYGSYLEQFRTEFRAAAPKLKRFGGLRAPVRDSNHTIIIMCAGRQYAALTPMLQFSDSCSRRARTLTLIGVR